MTEFYTKEYEVMMEEALFAHPSPWEWMSGYHTGLATAYEIAVGELENIINLGTDPQDALARMARSKDFHHEEGVKAARKATRRVRL